VPFALESRPSNDGTKGEQKVKLVIIERSQHVAQRAPSPQSKFGME
jgi:hypothetical protein